MITAVVGLVAFCFGVLMTALLVAACEQEERGC